MSLEQLILLGVFVLPHCGYLEMKRREGVIDNIKRLVAEIPGQKDLFADKIRPEPDYLPAFFDVAYRLLKRPYDASQLPRYLQPVLCEKALYKSENAPGIDVLDASFSDLTRKLARDLARFFRDATGYEPAPRSDSGTTAGREAGMAQEMAHSAILKSRWSCKSA